MCFAPGGRALFEQLFYQKWSDTVVFLAFWLWNVLRATTACAFWTSELPKALRRWGVLYILTSKSASGHSCVHFQKRLENGAFCHFDFDMCFTPQPLAIFISHPIRWLRTRRFSEPTFRRSRAANRSKSAVSRTLIFFLLTLSLL